MEDQYYIDEVLVYTNAVVTVRRPVLTDEERARRMKVIHDAAAALLRDVMDKEMKKQCQENS